MKKVGWIIAGAAVLVMLVAFGVRAYQLERDRRIQAELSLHQETVLRDSAIARWASADADRQALKDLIATTSSLGQLVAALAIKVERRDTVLIHDSLPTTVLPDGSRTAQFRDSTFAGIIDGQIIAPPYPDALGIHYTLTRPAFTPTIGFVQVGDSVVAVVKWQGEEFHVDAPYYRRQKRTLPMFGGYAEANAFARVASPDFGLELRAGGIIRLGRWALQGGVRQQFEQNIRWGDVYIGIRKDW